MGEALDPRAAGAKRLQDKVCAVTGAGQGIGRATARRLGAEGGKIVVAERVDSSGMRWIPERAEALLHLRCIELNGDGERFCAWGYHCWLEQMRAGQRVVIRTGQAEALPTAKSIEATDTQAHQKVKPSIAA